MKTFQYFNKRAFFHGHRGVTLMEIIITTLLFVTVSAAAYKVYLNASQAALESRSESLENRKLQQFFESFRHKVENAIQLPLADRTALQLTIPAACTDLVDNYIGWGFIPYPGVDLQNFNTNYGNMERVDPLSMPVNDTDHGTDAVRFVHIPQDSAPYYLVDDPSNQTIQASGADTFDIESDGPLTFAVGDFLVISDYEKRDLMRVTNITDNGDGTYAIEHDPSKSVWNILFDNLINDYGENVPGRAFVFPVGVSTYVVDDDNNILLRDDHRQDDGFDGTSFGSPGMARNWSPVANGITQMRIEYTVRVNTDEEFSTRTPQPSEPGIEFDYCDGGVPNHTLRCNCHNQVGNPNILRMRITLRGVNGEELAAKSFIPINLKRDLTAYDGIDRVPVPIPIGSEWFMDTTGTTPVTTGSGPGSGSDDGPPSGAGPSGV